MKREKEGGDQIALGLYKQMRTTGFWIIQAEPSALGFINNCTSAPLPHCIITELSQGDIHMSYFQSNQRLINCSYCYFITYNLGIQTLKDHN
jgi:hypothetical protein